MGITFEKGGIMNYRERITDEIFKKFESLQRKLKQYAHHPQCRKIDDIYHNHPKCKAILNLDKTIAFILGKADLSSLCNDHITVRAMYIIVKENRYLYPKLYKLLNKFDLLILGIKSVKSIPENIHLKLGDSIQIDNGIESKKITEEKFGRWHENIRQERSYKIQRFREDGVLISFYPFRFVAYESVKK